MTRPRGLLPCLFLLVASGAVYFYSLGSAPVLLGGDEAKSAVQAHSLATTGRDMSGRFMPLFVNVEDPLPDFRGNAWWQPFLIGLQAATLAVLPFAEWSVRLPSVLLALLNIALMYGIAMRLVPGKLYATAAGALLAMTPSHFMFGRMALDYMTPVTFVLLWLWCLVRLVESPTTPMALATGVALGAGLFTHVSSWLFMPVCLLLTLAAKPSLRTAVAVCAGFSLPLLLLIPWAIRAPESIAELVGRYRFSPGNLTFLQGIRDKLTYANLQDKVGIYWDYFNPRMLFFVGGANYTEGTRQVGVFLLPVALFLGVGVFVGLARFTSSPILAVVVAGLFLSPVPATLRGEAYVFARALVMLPFAVLLATCGLAAMRQHGRAAIRATAAVCLVVLPLQFAMFARDYFGEYQLRSAYWFDSVDFRDVAAYVVSHDADAPAFYLAADLDDAGSRWRFYLVKARREDLWQRTEGFDPRQADHFARMPAGSVLVLYSNDANIPALLASGARLEATITHVTGSPSAVVLRKNG